MGFKHEIATLFTCDKHIKFLFLFVKHCSVIKGCYKNTISKMFAKTFTLAFCAALFNLVHGNIFTDPSKLARLVEFQISLTKILQTARDGELLNISPEILVGFMR